MYIYILLLMLLLIYSFILGNTNNDRNKQKRYVIFAFALFIIIACLRDSSVGHDLAGHYATNYEKIAGLSWNELSGFSAKIGYEIGFVYFCRLIAMVSSSSQWFIIVVSIIIFGIHGRFIYKYSENVNMSIFIFVCSCVFYMYLTMIRQAIAISIVLIGFDYLMLKRQWMFRYAIFSVFVLIASTFHQAAILCMVYIVFDVLPLKRAYIFFISLATGIVFIFYQKLYMVAILFMSNSARLKEHIFTDEGMGSFDKISLFIVVMTFGVFILGYMAFYWHIKSRRRTVIGTNREVMSLIEDHENMFMYLCLMAVLCRFLMIRMNILNRMAYYFMPFVIVYYGRAVEHTVRYRTPIKYVIYILYFVFFVFMTFRMAGEYYGTVPYVFFWN